MITKKTILALIPWILLFCVGLVLLFRPTYYVPVVKVKETFTKQEKTHMRSSHREEVAYAVVQVQIGEELHEVTVRDNSWFPLKAGDSVIVTRNFLGKYVEKRSETAYTVIAFSVLMGVIAVITERCMTICQRRRKEKEDSGS